MKATIIAVKNAFVGATITLMALDWSGTAVLAREAGIALTLTVLLTAYVAFDRSKAPRDNKLTAEQ